jgi:dynein light chain LC8-type
MCIIVEYSELHFLYIYTHTTITIERENLESFEDYHLSKREEKVKMLEGKGVVEETDMPLKMQNEAMAYACEALDLYDVCHCRSIACHIKKVHYLTLFPPLYSYFLEFLKTQIYYGFF